MMHQNISIYHCSISFCSNIHRLFSNFPDNFAQNSKTKFDILLTYWPFFKIFYQKIRKNMWRYEISQRRDGRWHERRSGKRHRRRLEVEILAEDTKDMKEDTEEDTEEDTNIQEKISERRYRRRYVRWYRRRFKRYVRRCIYNMAEDIKRRWAIPEPRVFPSTS